MVLRSLVFHVLQTPTSGCSIVDRGLCRPRVRERPELGRVPSLQNVRALREHVRAPASNFRWPGSALRPRECVRQ